MQKLFEVIRKECSARAWSRGVELAREECVVARGPTPEGDELRFQVRIPGRTIGTSVSLFPEDEDWDCDCQASTSTCKPSFS